MADKKDVNVKEVEQKEAIEFNNSKEMQEMIQESVAKALEAKEKYAKKFRLNETEETKEVAEKAEKKFEAADWVRAIHTGDEKTLKQFADNRRKSLYKAAVKFGMDAAEVKALNEGTGAQGEFLVPEEFERQVIRAMDDYNEIRRDATVVQMNTNIRNLNELVTKVSVNKIGELTANTASQPTYGEPILTTEKYMGSTTMSEELIEDAEVDIVARLAEQFAERLAQKEQDSFINSAVSGSEGLLQVSGVATVSLATGTTFTDIDFVDLSQMQKTLFAYNKREAMNAKFYMSMVPYAALREKKGSDDHFVIMPGVPNEDMPATAWGRPIVLLNEMPTTTATATKFVVYADLSRHLFIGDRTGMTVRINTQGTAADGTNLNTADARELVIRKRTAQVTALESGIVTLLTNS